MKRFHRPFIALLLALLLLGSQQAAFAHLLSHAQGGASTVAEYQDYHGNIDGVAETCTTCIVVAAANGNAPPSSSSVFLAAFYDGADSPPATEPVFTRTVIHCRARAPPAFL